MTSPVRICWKQKTQRERTAKGWKQEHLDSRPCPAGVQIVFSDLGEVYGASDRGFWGGGVRERGIGLVID
jgi:hypothetical protein